MGNEQSTDETRSLWIRETEWDEKHRGMIANAIKEALTQLGVVGGSQTTVCTYFFLFQTFTLKNLFSTLDIH